MSHLTRSGNYPPVPTSLEADLRSDHAGEYGAVAIYKGILATARWPELREFAAKHLATEEKHLAIMEKLVPPVKRSRLLPIWQFSGWLLGALPATLSKEAVFTTIAAVEQFVEGHYTQQINRLEADRASTELRSILIECCRDEVAHKQDARLRLQRPNGALATVWSKVIGEGSAFAVSLARRL